MPFQSVDAIRYLTFDSLNDRRLVHAVFTRQGGISPAPWAALNVGATVGDDPGRVVYNRRQAFNALQRAPESLYDVWQVHSAEVVCVRAPRPPATAHLKADAMLTDQPHVTLFMRFADCVPILLYDPARQVVGLVHAGWQGTVRRVAAATLRVMQAQYGSHPADVLAVVGPSIGPHHYNIGSEVAEQVQQAFGEEASALLPVRKDGQDGVQFDLWNANRLILESSGVRQIEVAEICTACHLEDWYSHRAEKGQTGRFGALIGLRNGGV